MNRNTGRTLALAIALATVVAGAALMARPNPAGAHVVASGVTDPVAVAAATASTATPPAGGYVAGDFHTHTWLSDGVQRQTTIVAKAFKTYDLGWMANSDHGGASRHNPYGRALSSPMWRSAALAKWQFPIVRKLRASYPGKRLLQGVEWYVPARDHASVGIVTDEPTAVGDFDYQFDAKNKDRSKPSLSKHNTTSTDAVRGARWLQAHYGNSSYLIINHPSRKLLFPNASIRDLNDAAPSVAFGFEGVPGRQRKPTRAEYQFTYGSRTKLARTYGGADYMLAKLGGPWDSLLGEGRRFWVFGNSDFHGPATDFWPGQYTRTYTFVTGKTNQDVVTGMRSGNSFTVTGGLLNALQFTASNPTTATATMGQTITVPKGSDVDVKVRFRVPERAAGPLKPSLDHLDLIRGTVGGKVTRTSATNATTRVIKRFRRATPWKGWRAGGTWYQVTYRLTGVDHDAYLRLRGTNLRLGVRGQTDKQGNPLIDAAGKNTAAKAWADSWVYSNPIFIRVAP